LQGEARLAAASSASEGKQPSCPEQPADRGQLTLAADKPVYLERQIVRGGVEVLRRCSGVHGMPPSSSSALEYAEPNSGLALAGTEHVGPRCDGIATARRRDPNSSGW